MNLRVSFLAAAVSTLLVSGCGSDPTAIIGDPVGPTGLIKSGTDAEFYAALREGLKAQSTGSSGSSGDVSSESAVNTVSLGSAPTAPSVSGDGDDSVAGGSGSTESSRNEVTSTNVQEQNVDEQDWVKLASSGTELFILQSDYSYDSIPSRPSVAPPIVELTDDVDSFAVSQAEIAVLPTYTTKLRVMGLDPETPDSTLLSELDVDLDGRYAEGFYLYETEETTSAFVTASGNNSWAYWSSPTAFSGANSLITKLDVSDIASASVTSSFQFDGQLISSRRIGKHLFFASRYYPTLPGEQPWSQSPEVWAAQVDSADLAAALPHYVRNGDSEETPLIEPSECFLTDLPASNSYHSPDIITLGVLDLDTMQLTDSECFLGATETLYASANAVFLATTDHGYFSGGVIDEGPTIDVAVEREPVDIETDPADEAVDQYHNEVRTSIHQFDIDAAGLMYVGTGSVKGHLGWNPLQKPFRMSEKDGYLRVATFNDEEHANASPILLTVLQANGQGGLDTVSALPNSNQPAHIGKPGEQLYASRFLGDRAYLVTFRQTDPLYIIDLANPANPRIAGELEIEGYSDYLQPIGEDYLLGIGKDAIAAPDGMGDGRGALVQGVKISLFDVSNPADPKEVQSMLIGERGTHSNALSDHRAITIQSATDSHPLRVSFGIDVYGEAFPQRATEADSLFCCNDYSYSGLHGFEVHVGGEPEIVSKGVLRVTSDVNAYYGSYGLARSVMVNDALFYITGSQVSAAHWENLANPSPLR